MSNRLRNWGITLFLSAVLLVAGCGTAEKVPTVKLDSGVVNESYQGVTQPEIPKQIKLTAEEQKNGVKKVPIKSKTGEDLMPETKVEDQPAQRPEQPGGGDVAKPQV